MADTPLGRFCWYELMTTAPEPAQGFYGEIAGWGTEVMEDMTPPYTMWKNGETPIGGVMELPEEAVEGGAPPHWLVHISTPDLGSTKAAALERGAEVLHEMEIPEVGSFAIVRDPQGPMEVPGGDLVAQCMDPQGAAFAIHSTAEA